jgi:hypothetical protein
MPHHARTAAWTEHGHRRWFATCDQCGRRRLVGWYYEVYPPIGSTGAAAGWWYACADCLVDTLGEQLDEAREEPELEVSPIGGHAVGFDGCPACLAMSSGTCRQCNYDCCSDCTFDSETVVKGNTIRRRYWNLVCNCESHTCEATYA